MPIGTFLKARHIFSYYIIISHLNLDMIVGFYTRQMQWNGCSERVWCQMCAWKKTKRNGCGTLFCKGQVKLCAEFYWITVKLVLSAHSGKSILSVFKGELNPKIKFVVFERTLKITVSYLSVFDSLASFLRYFSFFDMQITHMTCNYICHCT